MIDPGVVANQNSRGLFSNLKNLQTIQGLENLDTSHVINMPFMFDGCESLTSLDVSHFDTSQVTDMICMFYDCYNLTSLDLSNWDTSKVTNMSAMFKNCVCVNHLVLGPQATFSENSWFPYVPAAGTKIPGTDRVVTAPYWVATNGYQQGQRYTSDELQQLTDRDQVTTYDWAS